MTTPESGSPSVDVPEAATEASDDLPIDEATAFGVEDFDPDDPWNAVLCVESERAVTVLPLTPKNLDLLVERLDEVREAQRTALGVPSPEGTTRDDRPGALHQLAHAARLATGSAHVARVWHTSPQGRLVIIGGAVLFVLLGLIASLVS
ncbi:hypothetical protein [Thermasporomyces composti]|uniref:Uncharacterized protein n=1 Tax=Thermasporomyces composti TaxID=696763 RepID=A0A3D9V8Q8_THECX|nr:hypothetical protein [Thermasporomyces composti]REF36550.1 hypothetical protein DFJ64_1963 [Thermasporomyces composti]